MTLRFNKIDWSAPEVLAVNVMTNRPEWASDAFTKWHKTTCDQTDPTSCGFEGQPWFQYGWAWCRTNTAGTKTFVAWENGEVEVRTSSR